MVSIPLPDDEPFFAQWRDRSSPHSLDSARVLLERLHPAPRPTLIVVGSKGKGTTVAAASAALTLAGLTVVTVSSPALVSNLERIRINGAPISTSDYAVVSAQLADHLPHLPSSTYLCPSGAYTVMGAWWADHVQADVLVLEEGMGGASDEVSFFEPTHLGITPIFDEHIGQIAPDRVSLIDDLLSITPSVAYGIGHQIDPQVREITSRWSAREVAWSRGTHANPLIADNIGLGWALGCDMAETLGHGPAPSCPELSLPGRMSLHEVGGHTWVVDAAISPDGVRAARQAYPDLPVVGCWPNTKDWQACAGAAGSSELVKAGDYLSFAGDLPSLDEIDLERDLLFIGTQSFVGDVLARAGAGAAAWF